MIGNIRVLIVDNQPRARQSLKALLATWPQAKEIREATVAQEAMHLIQESQPDVVLMDVRMPEVDGLEVTRLIKTRWPQVKVVVLTMYTEYASAAMLAGADAFICIGEPPGKLLTTLAAVAKGQLSKTS